MLKPLSYAEARKVGQALQNLRDARDLLASIGAQRAADKVRGALKSAEGAERHAERRARETEAAILYDLTACADGVYREEREQTMRVDLVQPLGQDGTCWQATVGDAEGRRIYWESGFSSAVQAFLWLFHMEDFPLPHNAALMLREAGIELEDAKEPANHECAKCGEPPRYGHRTDCPRYVAPYGTNPDGSAKQVEECE